MHIKAGSWESSVCDPAPETVSLSDRCPLASSGQHIWNRRLSPGAGGAGGAGGGGGGGVKQPGGPPPSPVYPHRPPRERRWVFRGLERAPQRAGDTWTLLRPPPAFPVQDSPAKLLPAVSYASKVKRGRAPGAPGDAPALGALLHNQWGLSFISDAPPGPATPPPRSGDADRLAPAPATPLRAPGLPVGRLAEGAGTEEESSAQLLLSCRHLVEALRYHSCEWELVCARHRGDPTKVVWYQDPLDGPA